MIVVNPPYSSGQSSANDNNQNLAYPRLDEHIATFQEIGNKALKGKESTPAIFRQYSNGLKTNRDAWCYNFSREAVESNMRRMIDNYNAAVEAGTTAEAISTDSTQINWNRQLLCDLAARKHHLFDEGALRLSVYRPFCAQSVYFAREMNDMIYQLPQIFPRPVHPNLSFVVSQGGLTKIGPLMTDILPDLHLVGDSQTFPPLHLGTPLPHLRERAGPVRRADDRTGEPDG